MSHSRKARSLPQVSVAFCLFGPWPRFYLICLFRRFSFSGRKVGLQKQDNLRCQARLDCSPVGVWYSEFGEVCFGMADSLHLFLSEKIRVRGCRSNNYSETPEQKPKDFPVSEKEQVTFLKRKLSSRLSQILPGILGFLVLVLSGCRPTSSSAPPAQSPDKGLVSVKVQKPQQKVVRSTTTQPATVHAYFQAAIHARVSGYLKELKVDIGQRVEKDKILGVIAVPEMEERQKKQNALIVALKAKEKKAKKNKRVAKATIKAREALVLEAVSLLEKSIAQLEADQKEYERVVGLIEEQALASRLKDEVQNRLDSSKAGKTAAEAAVLLAKKHLQVAQAQLKVAKAEIPIAEAQTAVAENELKEIETFMSFAVLKAPFTGVIVERHVDPGDLVRKMESNTNEHLPLFVVADLSQVRVRVPIPERDAPLVRVGAPATLDLLASRGQPIAGEVSRIAGMLDETTRTMLVEIDLPNEEGKLLPGMFGQATIELEERPNSLVLPAEFVRYDESGNSYVYIVDSQETIQSRKVTTGLDDGQIIEILGDLEVHERVVAPTVRQLEVGQQVKVIGEE